MTKLNKMNAIELEELKSYYYDNYSYDDLLMLTLQECDKVDELMEELQKKDNIINGIKKEINEQLCEYEKGKEEYKKYGNLEDYAKGLRSAYISILDKIKELENDN